MELDTFKIFFVYTFLITKIKENHNVRAEILCVSRQMVLRVKELSFVVNQWRETDERPPPELFGEVIGKVTKGCKAFSKLISSRWKNLLGKLICL